MGVVNIVVVAVHSTIWLTK